MTFENDRNLSNGTKRLSEFIVKSKVYCKFVMSEIVQIIGSVCGTDIPITFKLKSIHDISPI